MKKTFCELYQETVSREHAIKLDHTARLHSYCLKAINECSSVTLDGKFFEVVLGRQDFFYEDEIKDECIRILKDNNKKFGKDAYLVKTKMDQHILTLKFELVDIGEEYNDKYKCVIM